jgi:aminomethyltransferase
MADLIKKTPLYEKHLALNARMAPFGGYIMPIQYKSIIDEHKATRSAATLFDTCHMGEFVFSGPDCVRDLERVLSCPVASMEIGQCRYGFLCNEQGGVIDDQILYRKGASSFFMVVNAATAENDFNWIHSHCSAVTKARDISAVTAKIDLQGPQSPVIAQKLLARPFAGMKFYRFMENAYRGEQLLVSRTGYTGEIGFEFYGSPDLIGRLWDDCLDAGAVPAGLGARDTLRLEMGFPLYGHELDETTNAYWSGFNRALGTHDFIGAAALGREDEPPFRLSAVRIEGRRSAHPGDQLLSGDITVGRVTSGSFSPSLGYAIALGYLKNGLTQPDTEITIQTERGLLNATVTTLPFYRKATGRHKLSDYL